MKKSIIFGIIIILVITTAIYFNLDIPYEENIADISAIDAENIPDIKISNTYSYDEIISILEKNDFNRMRMEEFEEAYKNISEDAKTDDKIRFQIVKMEPKEIKGTKNTFVVPKFIVGMIFSDENPESIILISTLDARIINKSNKTVGLFKGDMASHLVSGNNFNTLTYGEVVREKRGVNFFHNIGIGSVFLNIYKNETFDVSFQRDFYNSSMEKDIEYVLNGEG